MIVGIDQMSYEDLYHEAHFKLVQMEAVTAQLRAELAEAKLELLIQQRSSDGRDM